MLNRGGFPIRVLDFPRGLLAILRVRFDRHSLFRLPPGCLSRVEGGFLRACAPPWPGVRGSGAPVGQPGCRVHGATGNQPGPETSVLVAAHLLQSFHPSLCHGGRAPGASARGRGNGLRPRDEAGRRHPRRGGLAAGIGADRKSSRRTRYRPGGRLAQYHFFPHGAGDELRSEAEERAEKKRRKKERRSGRSWRDCCDCGHCCRGSASRGSGQRSCCDAACDCGPGDTGCCDCNPCDGCDCCS